MESGDHRQVGADGCQDRHDPDDYDKGDCLENPRTAGSGEGSRNHDQKRREVKDPAELPMQGEVLRTDEESQADENTWKTIAPTNAQARAAYATRAPRINF